jgi:glycosyltransferase involved in cell wall biosynthesis
LKPKILFLTLRIFSATGGIEKVCRVAGKALYETGLQEDWQPVIHSLHGSKQEANDNHYFPPLLFTGFRGQRLKFIFKSVATGSRCQLILLSHINLLIVGYLIKFFKPSVKLVLLAHGIEVWEPLGRLKKRMLHSCDLILPVSHFTRHKMVQLHGLAENKCRVLNNSLDPFLERPLTNEKDTVLLARYGLLPNDKILLTVARMADTELYKGYDKVIQALALLVKDDPALRYLLVGKYGEAEKKRLDVLIEKNGLGDTVKFAGFVPDAELAAHFNLADIFIMPSEKEGFGIVFIEAMFYGKPVIAGNKDGSVDALCNGELGLLVDPGSAEEITAAVKKILEKPDTYLPDAEKLVERFGYRQYKRRMHEALMD